MGLIGMVWNVAAKLLTLCVIREHLMWAGHVVQEWLLIVTNAVVDLDVIVRLLTYLYDDHVPVTIT